MLLVYEQVVVVAHSNDFLAHFATHVEVDESTVYRVLTCRHLLRIIHRVPLPITELVVEACLLQVAVIYDDHLGHFVHEERLSAGEET